jgi:hypothetical protein
MVHAMAQHPILWPVVIALMVSMLFAPAVVLTALSCTLPQYYEVREDGLFIRQGRKKALLPYSALRELEAVNSPFSAPVFSTHRLQITAVPGGEFLIAVAEQERFLVEVARHAPQLEQRPSGLKTRSGSLLSM